MSLVLLSGFTLFLLFQVLSGAGIACRCFGEWTAVADAQTANRIGLVRNVGLILCCMIALRTGGPMRRRRDRQVSSAPDPALAGRSAFTLVELLVVIGIVTLLLAILLPALASVRRQSRGIACASNLRQVGSLATLWAADHNGYLPLDGQVSVDHYIADDWPTTVNDPRMRRYSYVWQEGLAGQGPNGLLLDSFMVAMLRSASMEASDSILSQYTLNWTPDVRDRLSTADMLQCPSAERQHQWQTLAGEGVPSMALIIRSERFASTWRTTTDYSTNGGLLGYHSDASHDHRAYRGNLSRVRSSASMVLAGDGDGDFMSWTPASDATTARVTMADVLAQNGEIRNWGRQRLPQIDLERHNGYMNLIYVDGHVSRQKLVGNDLDDAELLQE